jgi:crotonobetainyl-CoA:carnitine CoA-transferase CaiB-like acyl-CoA transferase
MNVSPYAVFPTSDGWFILAVGNDAQFQRFCGVVGIAPEDRWTTNAGRIVHREPLFEAIRQATSRFERDDLIAKLEAVSVPVGSINTVEQALNDPQVRARGMIVPGERIDGLRTPIRFSDADLMLGRPAPRLGETRS